VLSLPVASAKLRLRLRDDLPYDAQAKSLGTGRSIKEWRVRTVPALSVTGDTQALLHCGSVMSLRWRSTVTAAAAAIRRTR